MVLCISHYYNFLDFDTINDNVFESFTLFIDNKNEIILEKKIYLENINNEKKIGAGYCESDFIYSKKSYLLW